MFWLENSFFPSPRCEHITLILYQPFSSFSSYFIWHAYLPIQYLILPVWGLRTNVTILYVIIWISLKAAPEERIWVQVVYFGGGRAGVETRGGRKQKYIYCAGPCCGQPRRVLLCVPAVRICTTHSITGPADQRRGDLALLTDFTSIWLELLSVA